MPDSVLFHDPQHLAQALMVCWQPETFPETLHEVAPGMLALPKSGLERPSDGLKTFQHYAAQHHWKYELGTVRRQTPVVPTYSLVGGNWIYHDPVEVSSRKSRQASVTYDPDGGGGGGIEYILGAKTRDEADALLRQLTAYLIDGIRLVPLRLRGGAPFEYFWLFGTTQSVPLPVGILRNAPRAWWGPVGSASGALIFLQWPYSLDLPIGFLERLPWNGGSQGLILLSNPETDRASSVMVVHAEAERDQSIERFGELRLTAPPLDLPVTAEAPAPRFEVQLRLATDEPPDARKERKLLLRNEIAARQHLLDSLQEDENEELPFLDPIYFYYEADPSVVPMPLRRLLVEWTDYPNDLGGIYYRRLDASRLPEGFGRAPAALHVVTTARALGLRNKAADITLGARLDNYAPQRAAGPIRFHLLPDWARFGLRIFTVLNTGLHLYPRLTPGEVAAAQLSRVLLGKELSPEERSRTLVLLHGDSVHPLRACRLDVRSFRPIADAIHWQCAVEVAPADSFDQETYDRNAAAAFAAGIGESLDRAAYDMANRMVTDRYAAIQRELDACGQRLAAMQTRNETINKAVANFERDSAARLRMAIAEIVAAMDQLVTSLGKMDSDLTADISRYEQARRGYQTQENELRRLRAEAARLR